MHNLGTVISFEFFRTIKKRSFWISVLFVPVVLSLVFGLSYFSAKTADTASEQASKEKFSSLVLDESHLVSPTLIEAFGAKPADSKEEGIATVKNGTIDAFIYYPANPATSEIEVYAKDVGLTKNEKYTAVAQQLLKMSVTSQIDPDQVAIVQGNAKAKLTTYIDGKEASGFERAIAPGALLVLFYLVIVLLANQMLTSTTEEKENRVIEMILTTVDATTLIVGKIISLIMVGALQIFVISLPAIIAFTFFRDQLHLPSIDFSKIVFDPTQMTIGILLFVCAFMLFTGISVAIGAAMPTAKEANSFFGAAIGSMFVPLYALTAVISSPEQLIVQVFSFFPITAPVTLLLRNAAGNLPLHQAIIGLVILAVSAVIALAVATRAFRYGTLEYHRKLSLKELFGRA